MAVARKTSKYIGMAVMMAMLASLAMAILLIGATPARAAENQDTGMGKGGVFLKPNFEVVTYKTDPNQDIYQLGYFTGLNVGYSARSFDTMIGANYFFKKGLVVVSTSTDYKLHLGIIHFLLGAELGVGIQLSQTGQVCSDCKLQAVLGPHVGMAFDIGQNSALGIVTKVYVNSHEWRTPYYAGGLEVRIGF
ncbi:MAG: hypothetical protein QM529_05750 [Hydrotalea sp.]|nr:hypothetical protein [Hydrotalea sp.]